MAAVTAPRLTLRVVEVADQLGVSRATVARWVASGVLPHVAIGGVRLIRPGQLERFLADHTEGDALATRRARTSRQAARA